MANPKSFHQVCKQRRLAAPLEPPLLRDVSDTARWVAHYRALEHRRPDALFHDPLAARLAGERGRVLAEQMPKLALPWAIPVRTKVYDELILAAIQHDRPSVVLNLAAGMDTRPYRLPLPSSLSWVELDLPNIVDSKNQLLSGEHPCCHLERIAIDITDSTALARVLGKLAKGHTSLVVVTEGLLAYLEPSSVGSLAQALHAHSQIRSWVLETTLPEIVKRNQRAWGKQLAQAGSAMKFAPTSGLHFFDEYGWTPRSQRSCLLEAQRLGREPPGLKALRWLKSLSAAGRRWLSSVVVYGVVERRQYTTDQIA